MDVKHVGAETVEGEELLVWGGGAIGVGLLVLLIAMLIYGGAGVGPATAASDGPDWVPYDHRELVEEPYDGEWGDLAPQPGNPHEHHLPG